MLHARLALQALERAIAFDELHALGTHDGATERHEAALVDGSHGAQWRVEGRAVWVRVVRQRVHPCVHEALQAGPAQLADCSSQIAARRLAPHCTRA